MLGSYTAKEQLQSANTIKMLPVVSAEWNYNLFLQPYCVTAGNGTSISCSLDSGSVTTSTTVEKENFITKKLSVTNGSGLAKYVSSSLTGKAYKIVSYMRTNSSSPVIVNAYAKSTIDQYGSYSSEINSYSWTKFETVIGSDTTVSNFTYTINASTKDKEISTFEVYFTEPKVFETSQFDYENGSLWDAYSAFEFFRPGESYITSGNASVPSVTRSVTSIPNYPSLTMPCSPIMYNPKVIVIPPPKNTIVTAENATAQNPLLKNGMLSDMSVYKYFVSDKSNKNISAIYEKTFYVNKIVLKFNTIISTPTVDVTIGATTVSGLQPDSSGILVLYWNGTSWSQTKWTTMPKFNSAGSLALKTGINKISVSQTSSSIKSEFDSVYFNSGSNLEEFSRMQIIEISPRLEIDFTDFVQSVTINKSLDNNRNPIPISSIESNDASITLSGIPAFSADGGLVPILSNDALSSTLYEMLKKNVKFYINFDLSLSAEPGDLQEYSEYIPGGVFYADFWSQQDISSVDIQCFDITRYLQTRQVQDYVANLVGVKDIITDLLDFAGFTDYDYDSLNAICKDKNVPMDIAYYFVNSKDTTVFDAIREIFLAYQIGAYIDEYNVMRFLSLSQILRESATQVDIMIDDSDILESGYSLTTSTKPGKISMRYNPPQIKTTASLANITDARVFDSPSFVITTQNDVVWQQQDTDSCGFSYLSDEMLEDDDNFKLTVADLYDIFHTYSRNFDGYAMIEDEIVSFKYKEYTIQKYENIYPVGDPRYIGPKTVWIKNNLELQSKVDEYVKENMIGVGTGTLNPDQPVTEDSQYPYDIKVSPTGKIVGVERGLFGTRISDHKIIDSMTNGSNNKKLVQKTWNGSAMVDSSSASTNTFVDTNNSVYKNILVNTDPEEKVFIYPYDSSDVEYGKDSGYKTYLTKFSLRDDKIFTSAGIFFNANASMTDMTNSYFVEVIKDSINNKYFLFVSMTTDNSSLGNLVLGKVDITKTMNDVIIPSMPKAFVLNPAYTSASSTTPKFKKITDSLITLKVVHKVDDPGNPDMNLEPMYNIDSIYNSGEEIIRVYINGIEITSWGIEGDNDPISGKEILTNSLNFPVSLGLPLAVASGTRFGIICGGIPNGYNSLVETDINTTSINSKADDISELPQTTTNFSEIYATEFPLEEETDNYYYKTQYFLNSSSMNRNNIYNSFSMQTRPYASGINYYDVQYTTPAATNVEVLPVEYLLNYYPTNLPQDRQYKQSIKIRENALKYSVPINTGFRSKMMIANNYNGLVFLNIDPTEQIVTDVNLNLWTRKIIAPSDEKIIEYIVDSGNISESVQIDSEWIQSSDSANSIMKTIASGIDGFSKNISLQIFGNPLIQVGDTILLSYTLSGVIGKKYIVQSISQNFSEGLSTSINLKQIA